MPKRVYLVVVDADVARSSGLTDNPMSLMSRRFLDSLMEAGHQVALSRNVIEEWKKHQSSYSRTWLSSMAARKRFVNLGDVDRYKVEECIACEACELSTKQLNAALKDAHLVSAALAADEILGSMDDAARRIFAKICTTHRFLRRIAWVDPLKDSDYAWLTEGRQKPRSAWLWP